MKTILFLFFACFLALGVLLALPTHFEYKQKSSSTPKDIPQETVNLQVPKEQRLTYEQVYVNSQWQKVRFIYHPTKKCLNLTYFLPKYKMIICLQDSCVLLKDVEAVLN